MLAVFKREFKGYFLNVYGPIYIAVMLIFAGLFTLIFNYMGRSSGFEYTLGYISIALLVLIPVLAMRTIAEERKNQTIQLLYALPLRMFSIVMGKYLALLAVTASSASRTSRMAASSPLTDRQMTFRPSE